MSTDLTLNRSLKIILLAATSLFMVWLAYQLRGVLVLFLVAAFLAYILDPLVCCLEYRGLPRTWAPLVIFFALGLVVLLSYFLVPVLLEQLTVVQTGKGEEMLANLEATIKKQIPLVQSITFDLKKSISEAMMQLSHSRLSMLGSIFSTLTTMVVIPLVVFFLLKDGQRLYKLLFSLVSNRYVQLGLRLFCKTDRQIGSYLRGQFFAAMMVGVLSILALWFLHVLYFVLIGLFAGLAKLIPYGGPLSGALVAVLVVILGPGDLRQITYVLFAFVLIQLIDNILVQPFILARNGDMHLLLILFAVIAGGQIFGVLGMFFAVPVIAMIKVFSFEFYQLSCRVQTM